MEEMLRRNSTPIRMRNYGRILQQMVQVAATEEDEQKRHKMTIYIARSMRYKNQMWNKDQDSGILRVKEDIARLSDGKLMCDFPEFEPEFLRPLYNPQQQGQQKKRKKD